jgi:hypothetical protein
MSATAYPLSWPPGWKRTSVRLKAKFVGKASKPGAEPGQWQRQERVTLGQGMDRLNAAVRRLGGTRIIISTNLRLNLDGTPNRSQAMPADVGAAVYWTQGKNQRCMAIDTYDRLPDNLAAIAATLDAMRAIERYGGALILDRAFQGFTALPAPEQPWQVLGVSSHATKEEVTLAYRRLASQHHPDNGGDAAEFRRVTAARDALLDS